MKIVINVKDDILLALYFGDSNKNSVTINDYLKYKKYMVKQLNNIKQSDYKIVATKGTENLAAIIQEYADLFYYENSAINYIEDDFWGKLKLLCKRIVCWYDIGFVKHAREISEKYFGGVEDAPKVENPKSI